LKCDCSHVLDVEPLHIVLHCLLNSTGVFLRLMY